MKKLITAEMVAREMLRALRDGCRQGPSQFVAEWVHEWLDLTMTLDDYSCRFIKPVAAYWASCLYEGPKPLWEFKPNGASVVIDGVEAVVKFSHDPYDCRVEVWVKHSGPPLGAAFPDPIMLRGMSLA